MNSSIGDKSHICGNLKTATATAVVLKVLSGTIFFLSNKFPYAWEQICGKPLNNSLVPEIPPKVLMVRTEKLSPFTDAGQRFQWSVIRGRHMERFAVYTGL